jgi:plastocyanin
MRRTPGASVGGLLFAAAWLTATLSVAETAMGQGLSVTVADMDGMPVADVAILVHPAHLTAVTSRREAPARATLAQREREFVPHILIVEAGTVVEFPNHDEFLHHVYSFSAAKPFELPLYGGVIAPELEFERPGIVTLGCNIHDGMVGHIVVADTPYFALTDADGLVRFDSLPAGEYLIEAWTPRLRPNRLPEATRFSTDGTRSARFEIQFDSKLRPPHDHAGGTLTWNRY